MRASAINKGQSALRPPHTATHKAATQPHSTPRTYPHSTPQAFNANHHSRDDVLVVGGVLRVVHWLGPERSGPHRSPPRRCPACLCVGRWSRAGVEGHVTGGGCMHVCTCVGVGRWYAASCSIHPSLHPSTHSYAPNNSRDCRPRAASTVGGVRTHVCG